jgi:hypothetical protein
MSTLLLLLLHALSILVHVHALSEVSAAFSSVVTALHI